MTPISQQKYRSILEEKRQADWKEKNMSGEFDEFGTIPTLVFGEPEKTEEKKTELPAAQSDKPEAAIDDSIFSEEEKKMVDDFSRKIDIHNSSAILEYGAGAQKKMADFS